MAEPSSERQYFIDYIRVGAFFLLIFFHSAMPFVDFPWEIKNKEHSSVLNVLVIWMHQWRLPVLFFISGVGASFALRKVSVGTFVSQRFKRLFIPLWFAILFTIPFQVYFEKLQRGHISGSYLDFYPLVWQFKLYPKGALTWSHLWFITYLLVYILALIPVYWAGRRALGKRAYTYLASQLARPIGLVLVTLPTFLIYYYLSIPFPEQGSLVDDWFMVSTFLYYFFAGYLLAHSSHFFEYCLRVRTYMLGLVAGATLLMYAFYYENWQALKDANLSFLIYAFGTTILIWAVIYALLGYAKRYLNTASDSLVYFSNAVLPYYILHQTIIVSLGYYVTQWPVPIWVKFSILITSTYAFVMVLYHYVIRRFKLFRVLYGVK
jgi:peptidoglycan/LPS O-acetylase OafA/YrhL